MYVCSSLRKKAFEWVLCCLDVTSTVSSLSRCSVLSQVPRFMRERERERESVCMYKMLRLKSGTPSLREGESVCMYMYVSCV